MRSVDIRPNSVISGQVHISAFDPFAALEGDGGHNSSQESSKFAEADAVIEDDEDSIAAAKRAAMNVAEHEDWDDEDNENEKSRVALFIIDPQVDFFCNGTCSVPNADDDADMIAEFTHQNIRTIDEHVTLDSHHRMHIAHAIFGRRHGESPPLYATITYHDWNRAYGSPEITT